MTNRMEWWERPVRRVRLSWPVIHHVTGAIGEWRGRYLRDDERRDGEYETEDVWQELCAYHLLEQPCRKCEAASLGIDEGAEL